MTKPQATDFPDIGSLWQAKDGRVVRVVEVVESDMATGGWWVKLNVLPPYLPRQRKQSSASGEHFVSGFFSKVAEFGTIEVPESDAARAPSI